MPDTLRLLMDEIDTPLGRLLIIADDQGRLRAIDWRDHESRMRDLLRVQYGKAGFSLEAGHDAYGLGQALSRYFAGELTAIDPLPVETVGTPFQRQVWQQLRKIPCGRTISYGELARQIGRPAAVRAVGLANGSNPISIVVPCHRVIGADGSLTGYGGGIERKRWLLAHEQQQSELLLS